MPTPSEYFHELEKADNVFRQSPYALANELGLTGVRVAKAFQGEGELSNAVIKKIADHCGCHWLFLRKRLVERMILKAFEIEQKKQST